MRTDLQVAESGGALPPAPPPGRTRRLDAVEWGALTVFALLSLWTLGLDAWQVIYHGRIWTGTDGVYIVDQMQYLAWIRDASHHGLSANLFVLRGTPADYFQPAVLMSAVLVALGMVPWVALLLWKPVAVLSAFFVSRTYIRHTVEGRAARNGALVLALFFGSFTLVYGVWSVVGDLMPTFLTWGYTFGVVAMALMALAIVLYDRARRGERRLLLLPGVLGATASLLHPWQGELLVLIVVGSELMLWRSGSGAWRERLRLPAVTLLITGAALLYYLLLGRTDQSWHMAREASKHSFSLATILLGLAPLIVPALLAWRPRRASFIELATRMWLLAALAVWVLSASALSATPLHAVQGITLPLAVLAVQGVQRLRLGRWPRTRLLLVPALALLTIPATVKLLQVGKQLAAPTYNNPNFITASERHALTYLARSKQPGGVLARVYMGEVVPALTGRRTFVGDCLWSEPRCGTRLTIAQELFGGNLTGEPARAFVRATGARFLLSDCEASADLTRTLAPMLISVRRFGCATVYELDAPASPTGPLAESGRDAALRASWRQ